MENITCPIGMDIMKYPVTLSCGHTFDKDNLLSCITSNNLCPLCRQEISEDVENLGKNITIMSLIDSYLLSQQPKKETHNKLWESKITHLTTQGKPIVKLVIKSYDEEIINSNKTLLLLVVDNSGSMSGSPIKQVNYALSSIYQRTSNNKLIKPYIISYNSVASVFTHYNIPIVATGGTNFNVAFDAIIGTIKNTTNEDKSIKSV